MADPLRLGTLGAASITPTALLGPAGDNLDVEVVAVAARDIGAAKNYAHRHGIPRVLDDYAAVIDDPEVDAVYVPLPNSHHLLWARRALEAGKHVLCEKPVTANADEAVALVETAARHDRVVMEAFHYRHHPMIERAIEIVASGELGEIRDIDSAFNIPLLRRGDIRYRLDLAGGAVMDLGCYQVHLLRSLVGTEPEVVRAKMKWHDDEVDRAATVDLRFPSGPMAVFDVSFYGPRPLRTRTFVDGTRGRMTLIRPVACHQRGSIRLEVDGARRTERADRRSTYAFQLDRFVAAVRGEQPLLVDGTDSIANMRVIDAVYRAAGSSPRVSTVG